jgi:4-hydroxyphenylpyruvate dioxygenase
MSIQIQRLVGFEQYVRDLERTRRFYVDRMGLVEVGRSVEAQERLLGQESRVFRAGNVSIVCTSPRDAASAASRYLARHPDGVGSVLFEVADIRRAFVKLEQNGATPTGEIEQQRDAQGSIESFSITTPFGDTLFRFIERRGYRGAGPGLNAYDVVGSDELGFGEIDHITANLRTMKPALLWLEHVLEFEPLWGVEFHTQGAGPSLGSLGSGLRSQVLWEPVSGIKIANNEPLRPAFERSQVNVFCEDNRGDGIQHVALGVRDIVHSVRTLRERGVELMPAPAGYFPHLAQHLQELGIDRIDESPQLLEELGVLVDGSGPGAYLLQIFLQDAAHVFDSKEAGPFFFELIQRHGDSGFGAGNFRALFDSVERQQLAKAG